MMRIRSVGVLSVAKIAGLLYTGLGVLLVPIFLLVGLVGAMASKQNTGLGMAGMLVLAVCAPFFYGGIGFLFGALSAFLYNLVAGWVGGVEIELQEAPLAPNPPLA